MTTTRRDLPTRYDAAAVEPGIYQRWLESGAFARRRSHRPARSAS